VDYLAEEFYRRLMVCYRRLGRDGEAHSTYLACRKILSSILGVKPSSMTEGVIEDLSSDSGISR
jgi:DNA-binding SARP family transcriptional activator